ncbi:MAG: tripartite tricarboxylate transporter substrate-binding protein [Thermodesulfobacteriota bacterium]
MKTLSVLLGLIIASLGVIGGLEDSVAADDANYPARDITVVVPFRPGGGSDVIARAAAPYLQKYLPKPVNILVQNVDAAGGRAGTFKVFDAKPDGYTIGLLEPFTFVVAEVMGEAGARSSAKLTWLPRISSTPFIIAVSSSGAIKSVQDLKGKRVRAAASQASLLTSMTVLKTLGAEHQAVMYGGGADCTLATLRGDTDITVQIASTVVRQVEASGGKLVALATLGESRFANAPNVPTLKELGITIPAGLMPLLSYDYMYAGPPGLPEGLVKILNTAIEKTVADSEFVAILTKAKLPIAFAPGQVCQATVSRLPALIAAHKAEIQKVLEK